MGLEHRILFPRRVHSIGLLQSLVLMALMVFALICCGNLDPRSEKESADDSSTNSLGGGNPTEISSAIAGSPAATSAEQGSDQQANVDTDVPVSPSIKVTDAAGLPVRSVAVTFSVVAGGGTVTQANVETNELGVAKVGSWKLGPTPGKNELKAEVPGLAPVFFKATGTPDSRGSFVIVAGNLQNGRITEALTIEPTVKFLAQNNSPVQGAPVRFAVISGGGAVSFSSVKTDAQGIAKAGVWTMGSAVGTQTLQALVSGMPTLTFSASAVSNQDPVLTSHKVIGGLQHPWDMVFLPDGAILFTERGGPISVLPAGSSSKLVLATPTDIPASQKNGTEQSGHLGIALDPQFSSNRYVYTFVSSTKGGTTANRIRKWQMGADLRSLVPLGDIVTGMTYGSNGGHSGGRIGFGSDGYLYITTGDTRSATVPQDRSVLGGKVLRVTTNGTPAPENMRLGAGSRPEIFSFGFRNPQGLAFRDASAGGGVYTCEHGPNQDDEVTRITNGGNAGWNPNDGAGNYSGYTGAIMTDLRLYPSAMRPAFKEADSNGMSGCVFLKGQKWKSWEGALAVGQLAGQKIFLAELNSEGTALTRALRQTFANQGRVRSLVLGPDQNLYVVIDANSAGDGRIVRLTPQ